jgi:hypothetical protein
MTAPAALRDFVVAIQQAKTVPRPDNEDWKAMIDRISVAGRIAEVDEDTYCRRTTSAAACMPSRKAPRHSDSSGHATAATSAVSSPGTRRRCSAVSPALHFPGNPQFRKGD